MKKFTIALIILGIMLLIYISLAIAILVIFFILFGLLINKYWEK